MNIINAGLMKYKVDSDLLESAIASAEGIRLGDLGCPLPQLMGKCMTKRNPMATDLVIRWRDEPMPEGLPLENVDGRWLYLGKTLFWDDLILIPTLEWYEDLYISNGLKGLCEAMPTMRGAMLQKKTLLSTAIESVRSLGVINGRIARLDRMRLLAILAVMSNPSKMTFTGLYALQDDNSKVSWLFRPTTQYEFLSPLAEVMWDNLVSFGSVRIEGGKFVFAKSSSSDVGKGCDYLIACGIPVIIHEKAAWVTTGVVGMERGENDKPLLTLPVPSGKAAKFSRMNIDKAPTCRIKQGMSKSKVIINY